MDLSHVFFEWPAPTVLYTQCMAAYQWCMMQRMYTPSFRCRFVIAEHGKDMLFFYIHRIETDALYVHYVAFYVHGQCGRGSSLSSQRGRHQICILYSSLVNCMSLLSIKEQREMYGVTRMP